MERSLTEQEREISELVRRAHKNPDKTGSQRRETLSKLIDLTRSQHPSLKSYAAKNLPLLFKDFPELEETVIDAIYDLCEDPVSKVRINGYTAIVQISRKENKWIKRNADVLVQLLQSEEPDEVVVVKNALIEHLDMDPRVTFGVLCDQMTPIDESMDESDQETPGRLRSLVLLFLKGEAKRAIERHINRAGSDTEQVLVNGLLTAIPKANPVELEIIVKDILLSLPSYRLPSTPVNRLLEVLLDMAQKSLEPTSLRNTRPYLGYASFIVVEKQIAVPNDLLKFFCVALCSKPALQRYTLDDQIWTIRQIAHVLLSCNDVNRQQNDTLGDEQQISDLQKQVIENSTVYLEILEKSNMSDSSTWDTCRSVLEVCNWYEMNTGWKLPGHLVNVIQRIWSFSERQNQQNQLASVKDVQNLIRSLTTSVTNPAMSSVKPNVLQGPPSGNPLQIDNIPEQSTLPISQNQHGPIIRSKIRPSSEESKTSMPINATPELSRPEASMASAKRNKTVDDSPRSAKKLKQGGGGSANNTRSLLSRLGASMPESRTAAAPLSRPHNSHQTAKQSSTIDVPSAHGFSIKGAAKAQEEGRRKTPDAPSITGPSSLLHRLQDGDSVGGDREPGGRRRKRGIFPA